MISPVFKAEPEIEPKRQPEPAAEAGVDPLLLQFVHGRDVQCPGCGYNVRDLTTDRCPECGQGIEIGLRLSEPKQGALIAGLVGLAAGAGLGGLLLIYLLIVTLFRNTYGLPVSFLIINGVGFLAHGVALWVWVRNWNRIRLASASNRRLLVTLCWAMPLTFVVIFSLTIQ